MSHIFISHSTQNDDLVEELRQVLELHKKLTWVDSRQITTGDHLETTIEKGIHEANYLVVLVSEAALKSHWVQWEVALALKLQKQRPDGFKVIPLLLPEVELEQLEILFPGKQPYTIKVEDTAIGFSEAIPQLFIALGHQLPRDWKPGGAIPAEPLEELVLQLSEPSMVVNEEGEAHPRAKAKITYHLADPSAKRQHSKVFHFATSIGQAERNEIRWYVEEYFRWPTGAFKMRAEKVEQLLPHWGYELYKSVMVHTSVKTPFKAWKSAKGNHRFSVEMVLPEQGFEPENNRTELKKAASHLLSLPWEVLHDKRGYLFQGVNGIRVSRRLPSAYGGQAEKMDLPVKVLLLSPRPEVNEKGNAVSYFNHRSSALPMVQTMEKLGHSVVQLHLLQPPTFGAMKDALQIAKEAGEPYHIVHFDGHGSFDNQTGEGALCFEYPGDAHKVAKRRMQLVYAYELAAELRGYDIPLVYLDACHSAQSIADPQASVAASLLEQGVGSVIAMSHSVLVSTAQRFVEAFYRGLAQGKRISAAMLIAQKALYDDDYRDKVMGAGELCLKDWFVPVLFQDRNDPQLFGVKRGEAAQALEGKSRELQLGDLPDPPEHKFVGRSRELLYLERLLQHQNYAVVRGAGGYGKTTLAIELVRWLVRSQRYKRVVFVSVEPHRVLNIQGILDSIGKQLLPQYIVNLYGDDIDKALQPIIRELLDFPTLILFDNMESILPDLSGNQPEGVADPDKLFNVCQKLLAGAKTSRIIFTSRENLPKPFAHKKNTLELGRLSTTEAIELVADVMGRNGWEPPISDDARTPQEVIDLVEAVQCHPRALVQMAPYVAEGVKPTTDEMARIYAELERKNPGDRENSLYASVELSLRHLPQHLRNKVYCLALLHGGAHRYLVKQLSATEGLCFALVNIGLAEHLGHGYYHFNPGLNRSLFIQMNNIQKSKLFIDLKSSMKDFLELILEVDKIDSKISHFILSADESNLINFYDSLTDEELLSTQGKDIWELTLSIQEIILDINKPVLTNRLIEFNRRFSELSDDHQVYHRNSMANMNRLIKVGSPARAIELGRTILNRITDAKPRNWKKDSARVQIKIGDAFLYSGAPEKALTHFQEAYSTLYKVDGRLASIVKDRIETCYSDLRIDNDQGLPTNEKPDEPPTTASKMLKKGEALLNQKKYNEALSNFLLAYKTLKSLRQEGAMAISLHKIGRVYKRMNNLSEAENYFILALRINNRIGNAFGKASNLGMLGILYDNIGKYDEAIHMYKEALKMFQDIDDVRNSLAVLVNLAGSYLSIEDYGSASKVAYSGLKFQKANKMNHEIWLLYSRLYNIEIAQGRKDIAEFFWFKARDSYLEYRQFNGAPEFADGELLDYVIEWMFSYDSAKALSLVNKHGVELKETKSSVLLMNATTKIVQGSRDRSLADNMELDYDAAAEILFLIERLELLEKEGRLHP